MSACCSWAVAAKLASSTLFSGCVFPSVDDVYGDMSLESLIKMQSSGVRSIEEPNTPRPGGVPQGAVLVALDVTKEICTAAVYWALGNVVRRGDNFKLVGIITHVCNPSTQCSPSPGPRDHLCNSFNLGSNLMINARINCFPCSGIQDTC